MAARDSDLATRFPNLDASALKEIVDTQQSDDSLNNYLNMAYYATRPLVGKLGACGGVSAEREIVKLLAAHFMSVYDQQPLSMKTLDWSITYRGTNGEGLNGSQYGQQAIALDCSGILAEEASNLRMASLRSITYYDMTEDEDVEAVI